MDSDAHADVMVGEHTIALQMLEEIGFPQELVLNAHSEAIYEYINYNSKHG